MFINKKNFIKLSAGIGLSAAMLVGVTTTTQGFQPRTVEAARTYKVKFVHDAYMYNRHGKRKNKDLYRKGTTFTCYGVKEIHGKKYYNLGHGNYIKANNGKRITKKHKTTKKQKALFTINITGNTNNGQLFKDINSKTGMGEYWGGKYKVYEQKKDNNGTVWYRVSKNGWVISTDTNRPKGSIQIKNSSSNKAVTSTERQTTYSTTDEPSNSLNTSISTPSNSTVENNKKEAINKNTNETSKKPKNNDIQSKATPQFSSEIASSFIEQLNEIREKMGKRPLSLDPKMNNFAKTRADELIIKYSHTRPNGGGVIYSAECICVNGIDTQTTPYEAAKKALYAFLYDDAASNWGHRDALLNDHYTRIGVGSAWETKPGLSYGNYEYLDQIGFRLAVELQ